MDESRILEEALGRVWPDLAELVEAADVDGLESAILGPLRALDVDSEEVQEQAQRQVLASLERYPRLNDRLHEELYALALAGPRSANRRPMPDSAMPGAIRYRRCLIVPVFFGTDRLPAAGRNGASKGFGVERGELVFGTATVSIPDDHRLGGLEKPRPWRLSFRDDSAKHVVFGASELLSRRDFGERGARAMDATKHNEALIFVHGYNVSFADAARRAAQLAYDLHFPGVPIFYSWPSQDATLDYLKDGNNAQWTVPHFREFLRLVVAETKAERVHILAHSMGSRVVTEALASLDSDDLAAVPGRLGHLVFAAPDVDAAVFAQLAESFTRFPDTCTLYASSEDHALALSRTLAGYTRAGQSGRNIVVVDGIDTIDASPLDTGFMGHSYFGDHTSILSDLYALVRHGHPPAQRFGLSQVTHAHGVYWVFNAQHA